MVDMMTHQETADKAILQRIRIDTAKEVKREISAWSNKISKMETIRRNLVKILENDTVGGNWRSSVMASIDILTSDISYQKRLLTENLDSLKAKGA